MLFSPKRGRPLVVLPTHVVSGIRFPFFLLLFLLLLLRFPSSSSSFDSLWRLLFPSFPHFCWLSLFGIATPFSEPVRPFVEPAVARAAAAAAATAKGQDAPEAVKKMGGCVKGGAP